MIMYDIISYQKSCGRISYWLQGCFFTRDPVKPSVSILGSPTSRSHGSQVADPEFWNTSREAMAKYPKIPVGYIYIYYIYIYYVYIIVCQSYSILSLFRHPGFFQQNLIRSIHVLVLSSGFKRPSGSTSLASGNFIPSFQVQGTITWP